MNHSDGDRTDKKRTIVGGRPQGKAKPGAEIPRGVEVLLKMAALDPIFRKRLTHMRGQASQDLGFKLAFSEAMILEAVPEKQLQAMIDAMPVSDQERELLLSASTPWRTREDSPLLATMGIRPEMPEWRPLQTRGIEPDLPPKRRRGPQTKGIRPDED